MAPLHAAAQAGEMECLQWLVQHGGVSPSQKAEDGATPMHFAAAGGQVGMFKLLMKGFSVILYSFLDVLSEVAGRQWRISYGQG